MNRCSHKGRCNRWLWGLGEFLFLSWVHAHGLPTLKPTLFYYRYFSEPWKRSVYKRTYRYLLIKAIIKIKQVDMSMQDVFLNLLVKPWFAATGVASLFHGVATHEPVQTSPRQDFQSQRLFFFWRLNNQLEYSISRKTSYENRRHFFKINVNSLHAIWHFYSAMRWLRKSLQIQHSTHFTHKEMLMNKPNTRYRVPTGSVIIKIMYLY